MLTGTLRPVSSLTEGDKARMYDIMVRHYAGVDREVFLRDMSEKDGVILLLSEDGAIQGFSTYLFMRTAYQGDPIAALFSGDTIIEKDSWGSPALFRAFGKLLYEFMTENRGAKTYWFLITKGFRTYLLLPLFFRRFYPRHDAETPPYEKGLIEHLANLKYNGFFDSDRGIITAASYYLKDDLAEIPAARLKDPHVAFFLRRNPGYVRGEELACVCEISPESFRKKTKSLVRP
jgi:hypothetical protein